MWLKVFKGLVCGILLVLPVYAADGVFFDKSFGDFSEELKHAQEQGKAGVLVFFEMDECPFCYRMKTTILNQPKVVDYFRKNFLTFPVDIEGNVEITDFQGNVTSMKDFAFKQHRVRATPVLAFFDLQGKLVAKYTGATADADEFLLLGEFVVSGAYKDTNFTRYKRSRRQTTDKASGG
jgi:thioredoxin-related protein